jgi:hypothetical protein
LLHSYLKQMLIVCVVAGAPVWAQRSEPAEHSLRPEWESHRVVESARHGEARPHVWVRGASLTPSVQPARSPGGLYPLDLAAAYGINSLGGNNGGVGVTIAIVDAYDAPNVEADLATFSSHFSLPACTSKSGCFTKVGQTGAAVPTYNAGWEVETSLDVEWAHAIAPNAKILLVEAANNNLGNLFLAVEYAKQHAQVISMSWGGAEFNGESFYDSYYAQPGVSFIASAGDTGGVVDYPASSKNVVGVGRRMQPVGAGLQPGHPKGLRTHWLHASRRGGCGHGCGPEQRRRHLDLEPGQSLSRLAGGRRDEPVLPDLGRPDRNRRLHARAFEADRRTHSAHPSVLGRRERFGICRQLSRHHQRDRRSLQRGNRLGLHHRPGRPEGAGYYSLSGGTTLKAGGGWWPVAGSLWVVGGGRGFKREKTEQCA